MHEQIATNKKGFLAYRITGKITAKEYDEITVELERFIKEHGKLRLLIEIEHIEFPELGMLWEDLQFINRHLDDIERFAAVGDKAWEKWWITIVGPAQARFFDIAHRKEAWEWIQNGEGAGHEGK